jgi:NarL family two-component system response regulator LiaR
MSKIRLLIVDDHAIVRNGIVMFLNTEECIQIVGEAGDGVEAIRLARELRPDVILLDLVMPQKDGLEVIAELKQDVPEAKILVLTTFGDEPRVKAAIKAGAHGYLLKDADGEILLNAIHAVQREGMPLHPSVTQYLIQGFSPVKPNGQTALTEREKGILTLVARGLSNKEVAKRLQLSPGTVKVHVSHILNKLHVSSRTEASTWALQQGLVSLEDQPYH